MPDDYTLFKVFMHEDAINGASRTLQSGYITQGMQVEHFEMELEDYFDNSNVVSVNSCTSAISLSLDILREVLDNDIDVITTPMTCAATNLPIVYNNMRIVWCDVDDNMNIDLDKVSDLFSKKTRILMVVHWGGIPIDYVKLANLKREYYERYNQKLYIIEDCAHAWGSTVFGKHVGSFADNFACFSCQAIKTLTTGDGGVLLTPNEFYKVARLKRWFGLDRDNKVDFRSCQDISTVGFKYHMNDIAASIGLGNLPHITKLIEQTRDNAKFLLDNLNPKFCPPKINKGSSPSYWLFTVHVQDRANFIKYAGKQNVECNPVHTRNDDYSIFKQYKNLLPNMDRLSNSMVCVPCGWWLNKKNMEYICGVINNYDE